MAARIVNTVASTLPATTTIRTAPGRGAHTTVSGTPTTSRSRARSPPTSTGVYLRNTENPVHPSIGLYHPFDGDGMLHPIAFGGGAASYRNRFVRTDGFLRRAGGRRSRCGPGCCDPPAYSEREDGWGARGRMKDASSTDVVVHNGEALTSFWQCGDLYPLDPRTLERAGQGALGGRFPSPTGVSAHPKVDERTGELLVFNYGKEAPYLHYGVVERRAASSCTRSTCRCPGPRLPHDMAFTEHYAILNDLPAVLGPGAARPGRPPPAFFPDLPTRFAVIPRRGGTGDIRWFEADPTYVLHWINAYEDGDEIVLDGFFQHDPAPRNAGRRELAAGLAVPVPRPRTARGPAAPLALRPRHRARRGRSRSPTGSWSSG